MNGCIYVYMYVFKKQKRTVNEKMYKGSLTNKAKWYLQRAMIIRTYSIGENEIEINAMTKKKDFTTERK